MPPVTNAVLTERIDAVSRDIAELKSLIQDGQKQQRDFNNHYIEERVTIRNQVKVAHDRLDAFSLWQGGVDKLLPVLRAEAYVIGVLSVPVIIGVAIWIWKLVTNQAVMP